MGSGSPLDARSDPYIYKIILAIVLIVGFLFLVYFFISKIKNLHSSKEWIEAHKKLPTTFKDVKSLAKKTNMSVKERDLLWEVCKNYRPTNIEYFIHNEEGINELCRKAYREIVSPKKDENLKQIFFTLKYRLDKELENICLVTSTAGLPIGQNFTYKDKTGNTWSFKLIQNSPASMELEIPSKFAKDETKPEQLSKISLTFMGRGHIGYGFNTRIVRYEERKEGIWVLVVSAVTNLKPMTRRNAKRMTTTIGCTFSAAKKAIKKSKASKGSFEILEHKYKGKIQDISASGCRMICNMPIMQGQYLDLNFILKNGEEQNVIGLIVMTKKTSDEKSYVLHIKFIDIDISTQNSICEAVYGYND